MDLSEVLDLINQAGTVGLLILIVVGGQRGWYVWGWQHQEVKDDRNFWRNASMSAANIAHQSLTVAKATEPEDAR